MIAMLEHIKEIILDAQSGPLFTGTPRQTGLACIPGKASIIIGVRRSGKSTVLNQEVDKWLSKGVLKENIFYINFFDDRLSGLKTIGLDIVLEAYYSLYPGKKNLETVYCFFDEIQVIPEWESFIDRILRTENVVVYLSGSSAKMLSKEMATQMRGRALAWELFPFSFKEYTGHQNLKNDLPLNTQQRLFIENAFGEYWETGGFPEVAGMEKHLRIKIHQEYYNSILFRDLIDRYDIPHPRALNDLSRHLLANVASMYSINSLTGMLKSLGYGVPKSVIAEYISWFEDAYFLFTVRLYDASYRRSNANSKKIYCIDHALVRSITPGILTNSGHLLENIVFLALRRVTAEIWYYRTTGNREVDFIYRNKIGEPVLIQVCESILIPGTRDREIKALRAAMQELRITKGYIVTRNETEQITYPQGIIAVMPVWKFLLESWE